MGANFTPAMYRLRVPPVARALLSHITNSRLQPALQRMVMKRVDAIYRRMMSNTPIKPAREWCANWMFDGKTRETSSMPEGPYAELDKIEIPFVVVQNLGYLNLHQFGCYDLFENAATPADRKWMILAPPHYDLPVYDWQLEALAFFDHVLRKSDNGYAEQPPVRYWLDGEERYVGAAGFPIPGGQPMRFYPASGGADAEKYALTRDLPAEGGKNGWAAIPLGLPVLGGLDEVANQMLTYELGVDEEIQLAGPVTAHLEFSSNEIDSHVHFDMPAPPYFSRNTLHYGAGSYVELWRVDGWGWKEQG
jgi:uncharacterized protein